MKLLRSRRGCGLQSSLHMVTMAAALAGGFVSAASAQIITADAPTRAMSELQVPITLSHVDNMLVVKGGYPGGFTSRACSGVASLTNANFQGGSYTMQAGFAQGESTGATYTLLPSEFPVKIDLAEAIFATSNATMQTTTIWTIEFFQGNPQTGTASSS